MPANIIKIEPAIERRHARQAQRHKIRQIRCKILIVSEGTKTEPNYFEAFDKISSFQIKVNGEATNTIQVVDKAIELSQKDNYDSIWAVFDKDNFPADKFNAAILKAESNGIGCAWSNEAFELWYLYHFQNRVTAMSRTEYKKAISDAVNKSPKYKLKGKFVYKKNEPDNYQIMTTYGSMDDAIKFAESTSKTYKDKYYASHNPCTMVYKLVRLLIGQDAEFNEMLRQKLEQ